jgi:ferrochelatase
MPSFQTQRFDAILFLSFGGPDEPDDVRPFLENVTRGRGVPPERLDEVAQHYLHFGGVSPINRLNREMIERLRAELSSAAIDLPVYFGNRNWHPLVEDAVGAMAAAGHREILVFTTSAWGGYSGCRQYDEDIARALVANPWAELTMRKLPHYWDQPLFLEACADAVVAARDSLPAEQREAARLIFTAHSIPQAADAASGVPSAGGGLYSRQIADASARVAELAGYSEFDQVWQSRSGPPEVPWLEPDICDHLADVAARGVPAVIVCPVGFVSDHLEVVWDLDNEARDKAAELGIGFARAATAGEDPRFVRMIVELVAAQIEGRDESAPGVTENGMPCAAGCCEPVRRPAKKRR